MIPWIKRNVKRNTSIENFINTLPEFSKKKRKAVALLELYVTFPDYPISYYLCEWARANELEIRGYLPIRNRSLKSRMSFYLFSSLNFDNGIERPFRIFKAMGARKFVSPGFALENIVRTRKLYPAIFSLSRSDFLKFSCDGILLGDLIYDFHLRKRGIVTLETASLEFKKDFIEFMTNFFWWKAYFQKNDVRLVCVSHTVYQQAMVARVGLFFGAKVLLGSSSRLYQLSLAQPFADLEFLQYEPSSSEQFDYKIDQGRARAALGELMKGSARTAAHANVSGFRGLQKTQVVLGLKPVRIMIASHCYSDAPHVYGEMLFDDFDHWLTSVSQFSLNTDYEWYVKGHPAFFDSDKMHFRRFLEKNPHIVEIPSDTSNLDLFRGGINIVLTAYGTIAFEAAYNDVIVINASSRTPHGNYPFSLSPKSKFEYFQILESLESLIKTFKIDKGAVEHFFDLHHLRTSGNLLFGSRYNQMLQSSGGYAGHFTNPITLDFWANNIFGSEYEGELTERITTFLDSDSYFLRAHSDE
jgi:hypothetical protein